MACSSFSADLDQWGKAALNADPTLFTATKIAMTEMPPAPKQEGIAPDLLEKCLKRTAKKAPAKGDKTADGLVLAELQTKAVREACVRTVIAAHRKKQAKK